MSVENSGLVAKKRQPAKARQVPRLLMRMMADLPPAPPTKAEHAVVVRNYLESDHFDFEKPAESPAEKTNPSSLKERP